jgi:hypothetical protein
VIPLAYITHTVKEVFELDHSKYMAVSVNCTFNPLGEVRPDYVQFINHDESKETFKIQGIKSHKSIPYGIQYVCFINDYDVQKQIKLIFFAQKCIWVVEK